MSSVRRLHRRWVVPLGMSGPFRLRQLIAPKGNLARADLWVLGVLTLLPLATLAIRTLALPGIVGPGFGWLRGIGGFLNDTLSLGAISTDQREHVLYLLFLPTCALLVTIARLTFGIQVLGFRSILISVAFRQCGIIPSLLLITVAVVTIVMVRPWLRRIRLPYYGRVSVILCVVALTLIGPLLAGPMLMPGVLWGAATFPVIVLGMLAEGVARTLDRDNVVIASWRAITTILLAFVSALIAWVPMFQELMLQFPELVLTQIAGIVLVSEFLDLRLLRDWDRRVAYRLLGEPETALTSRVAVVRNRPIEDEAGGRTLEAPGPRSVQPIVDALRERGHTVRVLEGDGSLVRELRRFFPEAVIPGEPVGIVLNLAHGLAGRSGSAHVPALLEMAGIPYVGPTPVAHAMASDRAITKAMLRQASVPTPPFRILAGPRDRPGRMRFPMVVWPRGSQAAKPRRVGDRHALGRTVRRFLRRDPRGVVVEEHIKGRYLSAALLGNEPVEFLPLVEMDVSRGRKVCPAAIDERLAERIRECAIAAYRACGCRDYARVDLCVGGSGEVWVLEVRTLGILASHGSFALAGLEAGYPFDRLVSRIVQVARMRYAGSYEWPPERVPASEPQPEAARDRRPEALAAPMRTHPADPTNTPSPVT